MTPFSPPKLAIVVPVLNEAEQLGDLLNDLRAIRTNHEIIVADGGSTDDSTSVAVNGGARVVSSVRGRGNQLQAAVAATDAPWILALHADARLGERAAVAVDGALAEWGSALVQRTVPVFAFGLAIAGRGVGYRAIELGANLRTRMFSLPYGDQGLLMRRVEYDLVGGYDAWPFMEDVALVDRLKRVTRVQLLPAVCVVSARRWERDGLVRRSWLNWRIMRSYRRGVSVHELAERYR